MTEKHSIEVGELRYDHAATKALISNVIQLRDAALESGAMEWAVHLSHVIGWMNAANDIINKDQRPHD